MSKNLICNNCGIVFWSASYVLYPKRYTKEGTLLTWREVPITDDTIENCIRCAISKGM